MTVDCAIRPGLIRVLLDGDPEPILISWDRRLTILPGVELTVKQHSGLGQRIRLLFEAPRELRIRERPYEGHR